MKPQEHAELYRKYFLGNTNPLEYIRYYPYPDRTEWDITLSNDESLKEYCISSGEWTDIIYNPDGTFTHIPTKEQDIPKCE